ncbi:MAG: PQQ-binding-like beta-propeller repeat protein [Planctomycetes bacterium]|nr:PQQ-binding-like beta-propeller repeat protein [Planctomycetota bacterium]
MNSIIATVLVVGQALAVGGKADAARGGLIDLAAIGEVGLTQYWEAHIPLADGSTVARAYLVDDALYVVSTSGTVFALTAEMGLIRWAANLADRDSRIYQPAHVQTGDAAEVLVIPLPGELLILDRFSGEGVARIPVEFAVGSAVVGYGQALFMGGLDARFYSIAWSDRGGGQFLKRWEVRTGGPVTATPVLYGDGKLVFASQNGTVYSCSAGDKALNWTYRTGGVILGDLVVDDTGVYVAGLDRSLHKVDLESGELLWRVRTPAPLAEGPALTSHTVYQHCRGQGVLAIDAYTGAEKWRVRDGCQFVAHIAGKAAVRTEDNHLLLVEQSSGKPVRTFELGASATVVTAPQAEALYILGAGGHVLCIRPADVPHLQPRQITAARAGLRRPPVEADAEVDEVVRGAGGDESDQQLGDPLRSRRDPGGRP